MVWLWLHGRNHTPAKELIKPGKPWPERGQIWSGRRKNLRIGLQLALRGTWRGSAGGKLLCGRRLAGQDEADDRAFGGLGAK